MEVKDLAGISKPLEKLIDSCAKGLGKMMEPRHIKKMAEARAFEIETMSKSLLESNNKLGCNTNYENGVIKFNLDKTDTSVQNEKKVSSDLVVNSVDQTLEEVGSYDHLTIVDDINSRIYHKELKKEKNIYNTLNFTLNELDGIPDNEISDENVDEDWITRFFNTTEDINNEKLQMLWAKILAGEIKQPNTYSLRTLDLLKNLSFKEAETFTKVANFVIQDAAKSKAFILSNDMILSKFNISFYDILKLQDLDLLHPNELAYSSNISDKDHTSHLLIGKELINIKIPVNTSYSLTVYSLTSIGKELLNLVESTPNNELKKDLSSEIKKNNQIIKVFSNSSIKNDGKYNMDLDIEI